MLLQELIRLSSQHRTLYCYGILSIWIFMLIAGMYKYMATSESDQGMFGFTYNRNDQSIAAASSSVNMDLLEKPYVADCNHAESILRQDDGGLFDGWQLQGVMLLTRHGDRGPMAHVRGINAVDCGEPNVPLIQRYRTFLANTSSGVTTSAGVGHATWARMGPFHGSPLLPAFPKSCLLGQLTYKGIGQLMHVGDIMRQSYGNLLGLLAKLPPPIYQKPPNNSTSVQPNFISEDIVIYSTRYRRTFQSAMALMFAFLPPERWLALTIREAHSVAFCFTDCACSQANYLKSELQKEAHFLLHKNHPNVANKIKAVGAALLQYPSMPLHPMEVRDAILSIKCHNGELPCKLSGEDDTMAGVVEQPISSTVPSDSSDFINIDQDQDMVLGAANPMDTLKKTSSSSSSSQHATNTESEQESSGGGCIDPNHVASVMSYTLWQGKRDIRHPFTRQQGLLRAYGLLRNMVGNMLKMVSGHRTKFVLYSGHDHTLQFLLAALGVGGSEIGPFIPYAARLAFEVYRSDHNGENYFRVVYNGRDVTQLLDICDGGKSLRVNRNSRGNKADLCPIENIIRLIHDDYFGVLNATNFREACQVVKKVDL